MSKEVKKESSSDRKYRLMFTVFLFIYTLITIILPGFDNKHYELK